MNNIYDYLNIKNKFIDMSDDEFSKFADIFSIDIYNYGFDNLINDYNNNLSSSIKDWNKLKKTIITTNHLSSTNTTGLNIIKKCMSHIYEVENYKGISIKKLFTIINIRKALVMNRRTKHTPYVSEIIRQLGFMGSIPKTTIYRPVLTKRIVEYYNAKNILDVCTGWGGRMLGTCSIEGTHYTGIEPCIKTYNSLNEIINKLKLDNIKIYNDTAENILPNLLDNYYDIAITSPPYYNLEKYSDEPNQSINKYTTYDLWYEYFLKPVIYNVILKLKDNGKSVWSVKNIKTDMKYNLYDDIVELHKNKGWVQNDITFYISNSVRAGLRDSKGNMAKGRETTFVFSKI
jgi:16S rRNA G966 N2-methylase RsmD